MTIPPRPEPNAAATESVATDVAARSAAFRRVRIGILLLVLAGVLLFAWHDVRSRRARTDWRRTLVVGVTIVRVGPVDAAAIEAVRGRVHALEDRLEEEARAWGSTTRPFELVIKGPVDMLEGPPVLAGDGPADLARYTWDRWRYVAAVDERVGGSTRGLDSRIFLVVRPAEGKAPRNIEGLSEQGGRIGIVEVDLGEDMADFALFVVAHELFHTLGATDKYDASGDVLLPDGLAEPELEPQLPQRYVELMARHRPVAPGVSKPPESLDELRVGARTASEIGWRPSPPP